MNQTTHALLLAGLLASPAAALAESTVLPVSRSSGIISISLPADKLTLLALPLHENIVASGTIGAPSGSTLPLSVTTLGNVVATPHSIQLQSGAAYGQRIRISASTSSSVTTVTPIAGAAAGDRFIIVPDETIAGIFGATNNVVPLRSEATTANSDIIYLENNGVLTGYFYRSGSGWRTLTAPFGADQSNVALEPNSAVYVLRKAGVDRSITFVGYTATGRQRTPIAAGANLINNAFTVNTTLGKAIPAAAVVGGATTATSDIVYLENGGVLTGYFNRNGAGWRTITAPFGADQGNVVIPAGKAIYLLALSASSPFYLNETFTE